MLVLAKSKKGHEYLYDPKSAHAVSKRSVKVIAELLNSPDIRWLLAENQAWYPHEVDEYDSAYNHALRQKFIIRNGIVKHVNI